MRLHIFQDGAVEAERADFMFLDRVELSTSLQFLSYYNSNEETIFSLARADAWVTISGAFPTFPDSKRGNETRNAKQH